MPRCGTQVAGPAGRRADDCFQQRRRVTGHWLASARSGSGVHTTPRFPSPMWRTRASLPGLLCSPSGWHGVEEEIAHVVTEGTPGPRCIARVVLQFLAGSQPHVEALCQSSGLVDRGHEAPAGPHNRRDGHGGERLTLCRVIEQVDVGGGHGDKVVLQGRDPGGEPLPAVQHAGERGEGEADPLRSPKVADQGVGVAGATEKADGEDGAVDVRLKRDGESFALGGGMGNLRRILLEVRAPRGRALEAMNDGIGPLVVMTGRGFGWRAPAR